jgi:hypothetical protein
MPCGTPRARVVRRRAGRGVHRREIPRLRLPASVAISATDEEKNRQTSLGMTAQGKGNGNGNGNGDT